MAKHCKGIDSFDAQLTEFIDEGRKLYYDAFKNNVPGMARKYYAYSTAQFIVYGRKRLDLAMDLVKHDYEVFSSPYYTQCGRNYIALYLACIYP